MKLERKENAINHLWKAKLKHTQATTIVLTLALLLLPGLAQAQAPQSKVLQVMYVIPRGQTAKPDAEQAIAAIMAIIQRHYYSTLSIFDL